MPIDTSYSYQPLFWLRNGHVNTMTAYFLRNPSRPEFQRERIDTPDGDFLDLDFLKGGHHKLAILLHGLEGSSSSQYILGIAPLLFEKGYDVLAMNHRSCSGEINKQRSFYHSGFIDDFEYLLEKYGVVYEDMVAVGYSLGGNVVLRYAGLRQNHVHPRLSKIFSVSAPCDLEGSSKSLLRPFNRVYTDNFLKTLKEKITLKAQIIKDIPLEAWSKVKTLWDFDEYFTSSLHGFRDARDYYQTCSSLSLLQDIKVPTWLISSADDPFLSPSCLPFDSAGINPYFTFIPQKYGGHVGFFAGKKESFADKTILGLLEK